MKIKTKEISMVRSMMLDEQNSLCALCGEDCSADPVLDHNHKTGALRAVLHRQCNAFLGRFENNAARHGVKADQLADFLRNAASYIDAHSSDKTGLLHPTHYTTEEKAVLRSKRAKRRRDAKKRDSTK